MNNAKFQRIITIIIFCVAANLPFLKVVHLIGINTFIDSFHHPDSYEWIKNYHADTGTQTVSCLILEKSVHQGFHITNGDTILYQTSEGSVKCEPVLDVELHHGATLYYTTLSVFNDSNGPIYDTQILGKVTNIVDDNIWNALSLQVWDFSIKNLNVYAYC